MDSASARWLACWLLRPCRREELGTAPFWCCLLGTQHEASLKSIFTHQRSNAIHAAEGNKRGVKSSEIEAQHVELRVARCPEPQPSSHQGLRLGLDIEVVPDVPKANHQFDQLRQIPPSDHSH